VVVLVVAIIVVVVVVVVVVAVEVVVVVAVVVDWHLEGISFELKHWLSQMNFPCGQVPSHGWLMLMHFWEHS